MIGMRFFLFHGLEILGLMTGAMVGFIGFVSFLALLLRRPPRMPVLPAVIYFLVALVPSILFLFSDDGYVFLLALIFSFPWSLLFVLLATFLDINFGNGAALLGAILNSLLIYGIGLFGKHQI